MSASVHTRSRAILAFAFGALAITASGACAPSAVCTSDGDCIERFGPHATCVLSGERGMCFTGHGGGLPFPPPADAGSERVDAGDDADGGTTPVPHDGGDEPGDAGVPTDGGSAVGVDGGTGDAGLPVVPARILAFSAEPEAFFLAEGVEVSFEVTGAETCSILLGADDEHVLSVQELAGGRASLQPAGEASLRLACTPGVAEDERVVSEAVRVVPRPDVAIRSLVAGDEDEDGVVGINAGSSVSLSWQTSDAAACQLRAFGDEEEVSTEELEAGAREWVVTRNSAVELACSGNGDPVVAQLQIEVATLDTFTADDPLVSQGESTWLRWALTGARDSCNLFVDDVEHVGVEPPYEVTPTETTRYRLSCAGIGGIPLEASLDVRVLSIDSLEADDAWVRLGNQTLLRWQTSEAERCGLWAGGAEVAVFVDAEALAGSWQTVPVSADVVYQLRCQAGARSVSSADTAVRLQVTIVEAGARIDPAFEDSVTLFWRVEGTRSQQKCSLSGFGAFFGSHIELPQSNPGTEQVSEYLLTCYGRSDPVISDSARVRIWWGEALPGSATELADVAVVTGRLVVGFGTGGDHNPLGALVEVGGNLAVQISGLQELELPRLEAIGASLNLWEMGSLRTIRAPRLHSVGANVEVSGNPALQELSLPALASVGGNLRIQGSGTPLEVALDALGAVAGTLELSGTQVGDLDGFANLRRVGGSTFEVTNNPQLDCDDVTALYCGLDEARPWFFAVGNAQPNCSATCP